MYKVYRNRKGVLKFLINFFDLARNFIPIKKSMPSFEDMDLILIYW